VLSKIHRKELSWRRHYPNPGIFPGGNLNVPETVPNSAPVGSLGGEYVIALSALGIT
jgi:hypothetical protein